jgi:hypothetical protein
MGRPRGRDATVSLFHWVTATEDGIRMTACGRREELETFAPDQIGPSRRVLLFAVLFPGAERGEEFFFGLRVE